MNVTLGSRGDREGYGKVNIHFDIPEDLQVVGRNLEEDDSDTEEAISIAAGSYYAQVRGGIAWLHRSMQNTEDGRLYATLNPLYAVSIKELGPLAVDSELVG